MNNTDHPFVRFCVKLYDFGQETKGHHMGAFAAQSAFFIILAFFPIINLLLKAAKYLPFTRTDMTNFILRLIPDEFNALFLSIISDIYLNNQTAITWVSVVVAIWSASKAIMAMRNGLNEIFKSTERDKNYFVIRGISSIYTFVFIIILAILLVLNVFGSRISEFILIHLPAYDFITVIGSNVRSIISFLMLLLFFWVIYTHLPRKKHKFILQFPGAFFSTVGWTLLTKLYTWATMTLSSRSYMFGSLTTIIFLMFWLYIGVFIILIGGQINQFLEETEYFSEISLEERAITDILAKTAKLKINDKMTKKVEKLEKLIIASSLTSYYSFENETESSNS